MKVVIAFIVKDSARHNVSVSVATADDEEFSSMQLHVAHAVNYIRVALKNLKVIHGSSQMNSHHVFEQYVDLRRALRGTCTSKKQLSMAHGV